jgi:anthranilate synthase component 1
MTEAEFNALAAQGYNRIPLTLETFADLDTPLSIYLKLANRPTPTCSNPCRAASASAAIPSSACRRRRASRCLWPSASGAHRQPHRRARDDCDPLEPSSASSWRAFKVPPRAGLPRFCGGLVGCFGYDTVRYIEPKLAKAQKPDELGTPDILLLLSEEIAVVDNLSGKLTLVVYAEPGVPGAYKRAQARLKAAGQAARAGRHSRPSGRDAAGSGSSFGEEAFKQAVARAKHYIVDGDIMQVVLSQRMSKPFRHARWRSTAPCAP